MAQEKRQYSRVKTSWTVSLHTSSGVIEGRVEDISLEGAFIRCAQLPNLDKALDLTIHTPDTDLPILVSAEIVRFIVNGDECTSPSYGLAICFKEMREEDSKLLYAEIEREIRLQSVRSPRKKAVSITFSGDSLKVLEGLSTTLDRPLQELLQEAIQDLLKKYEKKSSEE